MRRRGGWAHAENMREGERDGRRPLSNYRRSKRDLKISMQIHRIIIPTVRLAPESYGGSLDLGLRHYTVYRIQLRYTVYGYGRVTVLRASQRRNPNPNGRNPKSRRASLQQAREDI